jgi:hypothetical protein
MTGMPVMSAPSRRYVCGFGGYDTPKPQTKANGELPGKSRGLVVVTPGLVGE